MHLLIKTTSFHFVLYFFYIINPWSNQEIFAYW